MDTSHEAWRTMMDGDESTREPLYRLLAAAGFTESEAHIAIEAHRYWHDPQSSGIIFGHGVRAECAPYGIDPRRIHAANAVLEATFDI